MLATEIRDSVRQQRLCAAVRAAKLDAVLAVSASEVLLLTGYWPVFSSSVAVLTAEGACHVIVPHDEQELAERTAGAEITLYKPELKDRLTGPVEELKQPLGEVLQTLGLERSRIGTSTQLIEQPAPYLALLQFQESLRQLVEQLLPEATLLSCDSLFATQMAVKTERELDRMRQGVRVARDGFAVAESALIPGLREAEAASRIQAAFDSSPAALKLERSYGSFFCMSGPNAATASAAYARTRQRTLVLGDLVMIHANTCGDGLWTDLTRTYTLGPPVARHDAMRAAILGAREAGLGAIRPGVQACDVDAAVRAVMTEHGFGEAFVHATGHGVGYAAAFANALPRMHPASPDVLEQGMTFNVEPAAYFHGYGGMRHCDVVAVTASGAEVLSDF